MKDTTQLLLQNFRARSRILGMSKPGSRKKWAEYQRHARNTWGTKQIVGWIQHASLATR